MLRTIVATSRYSLTVLLVDDDRDNPALVTALERMGQQVLSARSAGEARTRWTPNACWTS